MPKGKIYVIDDDEAMRDSLHFLLGAADFHVTLFESAHKFVDAISTVDFGCVASDVRMPGLTGLEILAGLRQANWSTAIVLMTAYPSPETREEADRLGADAFFAKPFDIDDLMTAVVNMTRMPPKGRKDRYH